MNWIVLKALHTLYKTGEVMLNDTLNNSYEINYLLNSLRAVDKSYKKLSVLVPFKNIYEQDYLDKFNRYESFLSKNGLLTSHIRFEEDDILILIFIADQKEPLLKNLSTIRTFSSEIFKGRGSKYLEKRPGLKDAVCKILGISDFPEKDPKNLQWRFVVDCLDPRMVILCENIAHLKSPWKAREHKIELWYVGGNNIGIIDHIGKDKLSKSLYYSCDWDFHGLSIYSRVKEMLQSKDCAIGLLMPYSSDTALPIDSPYHDSKWYFNKQLSGLRGVDFTNEARQIIERLIIENKWIEEESLDLEILLKYNGLLQ